MICSFVHEPLNFKNRIENCYRQIEQRRDVRPSHETHIKHVARCPSGARLQEPHFRPIGVNSRTGGSVARLARRRDALRRERDRDWPAKRGQHLGLKIQADRVRLACANIGHGAPGGRTAGYIDDAYASVGKQDADPRGLVGRYGRDNMDGECVGMGTQRLSELRRSFNGDL